MTNHDEFFFMCLLLICIPYFAECLVFCPLLKLYFYRLSLSCKNDLYIADISPFSDTCIADIFSQFVAYPLISQ